MMAEKGLPNHDIFISYRRDGGDILAKLLYETLRHKKYSVFFDYESLSTGDYREKILETVRQSKDVIVVLSRDCLERCKNNDDLMYEEISEAIRHNKITCWYFWKISGCRLSRKRCNTRSLSKNC